MYNRFKWANIKPEYISYNEFNDVLRSVKSKNYKKVKFSFGSRKLSVIKTYSVLQNETKDEIRVCYGYNDFHRYIVKHIYESDELKEQSGISGMDAYDHVNRLFVENNPKMSLYRAFSGTKYKTEYKAVKKCVPHQISYIHPYVGRVIDNCFKADVSSAFPSQMTKDLPTFHDCITVSGYGEPTSEYPFAFYTKSGHMKIYNELDTREMNSKYFINYSDTYNDNISALDEVTILCKKSKYNLKREFEYMYSQRNIDVNNKMFMNACIGYFHRNADPRLSLLAACVIARNNKMMLDRINTLISEGNTIIYVATDSIVWRGHESSVATEDKYLGSFTYEGKCGKFFGRMVGSYQYLDNNNNLTTKCSYLKNDDSKINIAFGKLPEAKNTRLIRDKEGYIIKVIGG